MAEKFQINSLTEKAPPEKKGSPIATGFKALSKREQIMIYLLVIVAVVGGLVFLVIIPALDNLTTLQAEVDDLKVQEMDYRHVIAQTDNYLTMYDEAKTTYNKAKKKYFKPMKPETLDEKVTGYLTDAGFDPETLSMSTLNVEGVPPYYASVLNPTAVPEPANADTASEGAIAEGTEGQTPAETTENAAAAADSGYADAVASMGGAPTFVYTVNVSVAGEWSNLYRLLDAVKKKSGIEIVSYQYNAANSPSSAGGSASTGTTDGVGSAAGTANTIAQKDTISLIIKVYVFVKGVPASTGDSGAAVQ
jgi:hypothetical protein